MLLIDANILVRCSQGRAMLRLHELRAAGTVLATTDRNVAEFGRKLIEVFGWDEEAAWTEVDRVLEVLIVLLGLEYEHARTSAERRLGVGGKSDWPLLAAALASDSEIWSDDRDFFGVGVPVWATHNVAFAAPQS